MTLIDSAEMYGEGAAEHLVGQAIRGYDRERLYLVSKVYPFHAGRHDIFQSCENSLRRMGTDYLDLYLLHWRGSGAAGRDGGLHGGAEGKGPHPQLGRLQPGHRRHGGAV